MLNEGCYNSLLFFFLPPLAITQAKLTEELAPHVAPKWYMLAVLLNISKPIVDKISKGFIENGNSHYSLSEVVEAWLEEINAACHKTASHELTSTESTREAGKIGEPSRYWLQIYHVIKRMGYVTFARKLDAKHGKFYNTHTL